MREKTYHEEIVPLSCQETKDIVELLKQGRIVRLDNLTLTSQASNSPLSCAECTLPRPCRDNRTTPNICLVCVDLDWAFSPKLPWRRIIKLADRQDYKL